MKHNHYAIILTTIVFFLLISKYNPLKAPKRAPEHTFNRFLTV